ncbi:MULTISPECIES: class I SAM-dependent methyltransferase [Kitasatospora]|uniref:Putative methyltransferase n=1 Tax=Kitasatospora setae (strain ATCC 33774 / DSM 43861 / JCM 3304 / KCC A-0304 / NBRC 14216 / KM-6054) TaxID=452652 RepID=E4NIK9_KITSK|nr:MULTISPECIES: class I SAM-dependent methyltransferase [Kitasatospora]BAJ32807.1 putative methyltransferase [Kitasatospora setae KM-6054]
MTATPEIMTAFTSGLADINLDESSTPRQGGKAAGMKKASATIYDMAATLSGGGDLWNWGMYDAGIAEEIRALLPGFGEPWTDGFSQQLYFLALRDLPVGLDGLAGRDVLEVGCGIGGGLDFLSRIVPGARMTGLDLSPVAITRANATLARGDSLRFVHGDAEELPFEDASVDVLVNIESSHTYPDLGRFLREVERVLRPGGHLSHIDVFTRQRYAAMRKTAAEIDGLEWTTDHDISAEVRAAVRRRMAPGSHFRKKLERQRLNPLMRQIVAHSQILMFGGMFAGYRPNSTIRALSRIGVVPWMSGLPMESYRHQIAVRR